MSRSTSPTTAALTYTGQLAPSLQSKYSSRDSMASRSRPHSSMKEKLDITQPIAEHKEEHTIHNEENEDHNEMNTIIRTFEKFTTHDGRQPTYTPQHPLVQDYIRNYLYANGFANTFAAFQNEWYDRKQEDSSEIPSIYVQNTQLETNIAHLENQLHQAKDVANKAKDTFTRLRKQRDFHRLAHKQALTDKSKQTAAVVQLNNDKQELQAVISALEKKLLVAQKELVVAKLTTSSKKKAKEGDPVSPTLASPPKVKNREWKCHTQKSMEVASIRFHPKKRIVLVGAHGWRALSFPACGVLLDVPSSDLISDMSLNPSGSDIATLTNGTANIWDVSNASLQVSIPLSQNAQSLVYSEAEELLLVLADQCYLLNGKGAQLVKEYVFNHQIIAAAFRPGNTQMFLAGYESGGVELIDTFSGEVITTIDDLSEAIRGVRWSLDGQSMVYWSASRAVLRRGDKCTGFNQGNITSCAISSDGTMIVIGTAEGDVATFSRETETCSAKWKAHSGSVNCIEIDRNDEFVVTSGQDGILKVWT